MPRRSSATRRAPDRGLIALALAIALPSCAPPESVRRETPEDLQRELQHVDAIRLLAQAQLAVDDDPTLALLLALEGAKTHRGPMADAALRAALDALRERQTLLGHAGPVRWASFSRDGQTAVTTSEDGSARLWDVATGECVRVLDHGEERVLAAVFGPNGVRLVTRTSNGWLGTRLWDPRSGDLVARLVGAGDVVFSPDGTQLAGPTRGGGVTLWRTSDGEETTTLFEHKGQVVSVRFDPRGETLLSAADDFTTRLFDLGKGYASRVFSRHRLSFLTGARFDPSGTHVLTAARSGETLLWELASGKSTYRLDHEGAVVGTEFSPDGELLLTRGGWREDTVWAWDARAMQPLFQLRGWGDVALDPRGELVATAASTERAAPTLWDARTGERRGALRGHVGQVHTVRFHPEGNIAITAGADGTARLWHRDTGRARRTFGESAKPGTGLAALDPTGSLVATCHDDTVRIHDARTSEEMLELDAHDHQVTALAFSPDGKRLLTACMGGAAILWDVETGLEEHFLQRAGRPILHVGMSPDGTRALTLDDRQAVLWNTQRGRRVAELGGRDDEDLALARFESTPGRILTCARDGEVRVRDGSDGSILHTLPGREPRWARSPAADKAARPLAIDEALVFAANGRAVEVRALDSGALLTNLPHPAEVTQLAAVGAGRLLTAARDGIARLWDAHRNTELQRFTRSDVALTGLAVHAERQLIVTADETGTAYLFELESARCLAELRGHSEILRTLTFDRAGDHVLTACPLRAMRWTIDARAEAERQRPREFTPSERARFLRPFTGR